MEVMPRKTPSSIPVPHTTTPEKRVLGLLGTKIKVPLKPISSTAFSRKNRGVIPPGEKGVAIGHVSSGPSTWRSGELGGLKQHV